MGMSDKTNGGILRHIIHLEHKYVRAFGRFTLSEVRDNQRVLPRAMRRRWARRQGMIHVPIVVTTEWLETMIRDLNKEIARRESIKTKV